MGTLATQIRDRLGPAPQLPDPPLVSIVVLNRDGLEHLRRLLAGLAERTDYPNLELILVDNGSSDGSLEYIRSVEAPFPISILANPHNESFSDANNQGAGVASGELLLFLNNDVEPFEAGWLRELVACHRESGAGAVGATLIHPDKVGEHPDGYRVQTQQVRILGARDDLAFDPNSRRPHLFDEHFGEDVETALAIGACLLIEREAYSAVGGFTHGYFYGGEDEDLCLKLRARGLDVLYSGRSILVHHVSSTSRKLLGETGGSIRTANSLLLRKHWGPRVWREYHLDRLDGCKLWAVPGQEESPDSPALEEVLALGFCLRADRISAKEAVALAALDEELGRRGHRRLTLLDDSIDTPQGLYYDVAVYLRGPTRYIPLPGQLNVLWAPDRLDAVSGIERRRYDLVVGDCTVGDLVDAVLARAAEIEFPTRVEAPPAPPARLADARR